MNASWMLHLYPRAWRERYEDEFRAMLDGSASTPSDMLDMLSGAVDAHLRPQVETAGGKPSPRISRSTSPGQGSQAFFFAHMAFFIILNAVLFIINGLVSRDTWWAWYSLWGTAMVLVIHGGITFPWRSYFGAHLALYGVLNTGLVVINISNGGPAWSVWPVVTLGVLLVSHGLLAFGRISLFRAHVLATALATLELLVVPFVVNDAGVASLLLSAAQLWVLVLAHWLVRFQRVSLFTAHLVTFIGMGSLLTLSNAADDSGIWWVRYPLVAWGILLAAHALLTSRRDRSTGSERASMMLGDLGVRAKESPRQRHRRVFGFHVGSFVLGSIILVVLDLMDRPSEWWSGWPIGVWLVILAMHAGWVLMPRRLAGAHLVGWVAGSVALIQIDVMTDGGPWWQWPVLWWGVVVALHLGTLIPARTMALGMHIAGAIALTVALFFTNEWTAGSTWWWYPVAAIAFSVLMHFGWMIERSMARGSNIVRR
jgi:hypothetical protein